MSKKKYTATARAMQIHHERTAERARKVAEASYMQRRPNPDTINRAMGAATAHLNRADSFNRWGHTLTMPRSAAPPAAAAHGPTVLPRFERSDLFALAGGLAVAALMRGRGGSNLAVAGIGGLIAAAGLSAGVRAAREAGDVYRRRQQEAPGKVPFVRADGQTSVVPFTEAQQRAYLARRKGS